MSSPYSSYIEGARKKNKWNPSYGSRQIRRLLCDLVQYRLQNGGNKMNSHHGVERGLLGAELVPGKRWMLLLLFCFLLAIWPSGMGRSGEVTIFIPNVCLILGIRTYPAPPGPALGCLYYFLYKGNDASSR